MWRVCGKAKERQSQDVTGGPWCPSEPGPETPGAFSPGTTQGLSVLPLQWKSGSLNCSFLSPLSTCLHANRNEAVSTCSSSRWSLSPCISAHDLASLLLLLFLLYFLPHFSPLVTVPFLAP